LSEPIDNTNPGATRNPIESTDSNDIVWPISYRLQISKAGILDFAYSYNNGAPQLVLASTDIAKINGHMPDSFRFGFSATTSVSTNVHEITCFQASPLRPNSSAGANTQEGKRVSGDTQFFLASYSSDGWWGSLVAHPLSIVDGELSISTV